jgi:hypothetical protein
LFSSNQGSFFIARKVLITNEKCHRHCFVILQTTEKNHFPAAGINLQRFGSTKYEIELVLAKNGAEASKNHQPF